METAAMTIVGRTWLRARGSVIRRNFATPVLVAEVGPDETDQVRHCLRVLGYPARSAASAEEALVLIRQMIFARAVVAAEMQFGEEPALRRFALLPGLEQLVAIGVSGDLAMERRARAAGAQVYLSRPVQAAMLGHALGLVESAGLRRGRATESVRAGDGPTARRAGRRGTTVRRRGRGR